MAGILGLLLSESSGALGGFGDKLTIFGIILAMVFYLLFVIVLGILNLVLLKRKIWKAVAQSIVILNPELLDDLVGRIHDQEGGFGAGLADALDVGGFDVEF